MRDRSRKETSYIQKQRRLHKAHNLFSSNAWCGVPIAAWPMYAEQQANAFELVKDLGIAVEIKMDYRSGSDVIVKAEEIEKGIRLLMEPDSEMRTKMNQLKNKSRMTLMEGGSSYDFLRCFIDNVFDNIA